MVTGHVIFRLIQRHFQARQQLEQRVQERTRALSRLADHLAQSQEAERRRVARDLHDEMGQLLTAMGLELGVARATGASEELRRVHDRLQELVDEGLRSFRHLVESLRPRILDERGLEQALSWYCDQVGKRAELQVAFEAQGDVPPNVEEAAVAAFRIVQEALTNIVRHARASRADVRMRSRDGILHLEVRDDGVGFDPGAAADRGFGLVGMRERARGAGGRLDVRSSEQGGTRVTVELPLDRRGDDAAEAASGHAAAE
ncbi:MAG: sensor histidine kinase [Myxococcota bacterium]